MTEDELILTHILNCSRSELYLQKPQLTDQQQKQFESYKLRRQDGEPLQYILGTCNFMGFELKVDSRVLIPRPETEVLVDEAVKRLKNNLSFPHALNGNPESGLPIKTFGGDNIIKILDLGTGSGCIAIALAILLTDSKVTSVDVSQDALDLAKENVSKYKLEQRINLVHADMVDFLFVEAGDLSAGRQEYDLIISNPPYISEDQIKTLPKDVLQEPALALKAGKDGLIFYRDIIKYSPCLLREGAYLMMEFGDACLPAGRDKKSQSEEIQQMIEQTESFSLVEIIKDLTGRDRIVCAQKILGD